MQGSTLIPALKENVFRCLCCYRVFRVGTKCRAGLLAICEEEVIESRLTTVKYILWAIPSIGFLQCLFEASERLLARADEAMPEHKWSRVKLRRVAFNSTFTALFVSLFLTLVANSLREGETEKIVKCKDFVSGDFMIQLKSIELDGASKKAVS